MKLDVEIPARLWPFCASEIYAFTLGGARFIFPDPPDPWVALITDDVRTEKLELAAALKSVRGARLSPENRQRAAVRIAELRESLIKRHLRLLELSIGYRESITAPARFWP